MSKSLKNNLTYPVRIKLIITNILSSRLIKTSSVISNLLVLFCQNFKAFIKIYTLIILIFLTNVRSITADDKVQDLPPLPILEGVKEQDEKVESDKNLRPLKSPSFFQRIKNIFGKGEDKKPLKKIITEESNTEESNKDDDELFINLNSVKLPKINNEEAKEAKGVEIPKDFQNQQAADILDKNVKNEPNIVNNSPDNLLDKSMASPGDQKKNESPAPVEIPQLPNASAATDSSPVTNSNGNKLEKISTLPNVPASLVNSSAADTTSNLVTSSDGQAVSIEANHLDNEKAQASIEPVKIEIPTLPTIPLVPNVPVPINSAQTNEGSAIIIPDLDNSNDISSEQSRFVIDEAKVLLLPNDDVVLGQLSETARIDQLDFSSYLQIYKQQQEYFRTSARRQVVENFIASYNDNFNQILVLPEDEYKTQAFDAVDRNSLFQLKALMDNFLLLQQKNLYGNTLLHQATINNDYQLVKFLLMRGANLSTLNKYGETALNISETTNKQQIYDLLRKAGAH